jgi:hypothetical protein
MDVLNDLLSPYPPNPLTIDLSDSELSENEEHIKKIKSINKSVKRKKEFSFDDWCMIYSDELWNLWCTIQHYRENGVLDRLNFADFCAMCYDNSTKT